jgi:hypothetical protein
MRDYDTPLHKRLIKASVNATDSFWASLSSDLMHLPDLEETNVFYIQTIRAAIGALIANYLVSFEKDARALELENLIYAFREIERTTRNIDVTFED